MISRRSVIRGSTALITSALLLPRKSRAWTHGGSGGSGYVAKAVHFDGISTCIANIGSIFPADGKALLYSHWVTNCSGGTDLVSSRPEQAFSSQWTGGAIEGGPYVLAQGQFGDNDLEGDWLGAALSGPTWHHLLCKLNPAQGGLAAASQMVIDGTLLVQSGNSPSQLFSGALPFNWNISTEETTLFIGGDGSGVPGTFSASDQAQLYIAYGDAADLDLSNPVNIAKFISGGKPVNVLASGAPTPLVLFDGNASTYANNQGTASPFFLGKVIISDTISTSGPGSVSLPGAVQGASVFYVGDNELNLRSNVTSAFETIISVAGQIQQTSNDDFSGGNVFVILTGTLTNASTSPSD